MQENGRVNLNKESWTDPVTGEIYPGGRPSSVFETQQTTMQYPNVQGQQANMSPFNMPPNMQSQGMNGMGAMGGMGFQTMPQGMNNVTNGNMKYCQYCGSVIPRAAVICTNCGCQVEQFSGGMGVQPNIIINNNNTNGYVQPMGVPYGKMKDKTVALLLCIFLGLAGAHRFYEGKIGTGILWFCTGGLFLFGWIIDLIIILGKPNPYYV